MLLYDFLLSASGMSLSNKLSSVLLKVFHLVARYIVPFMWMFYLLLDAEYKQGGHLLKRVLGSDTFRFHLSKFLSAVGGIFQIFCPREVHFFKVLNPFRANFVLFVCFTDH